MPSKISQIDIELVKQYAQESTTLHEFIIKLGYSPNSGGSVNKTVQDFCQKNNISLSHFTSQQNKPIVRTVENIFIKSSTAAQTTLRKWYLKGNYTPYKCSICGQPPIWQDKPLVLVLDHINGDNTDDRLENLRWVCPNCDHQLPTFTSKNRRDTINNTKQNVCKICGSPISSTATYCIKCYAKQQQLVDRPNKEELLALLQEHKGNFSMIGRIFNLSDNAIRKWCKSYGLSTHSGDYKT